ncbi:MAG: hypothetical protein ACUVXG_03360 [Anaerolineae bacterium]
MTAPFSESDVLFLIETLMPGRPDAERLAKAIQDDPTYLEAMLGDDRVFQRLMSDEEALLKVSPRFFFDILLRKAARDLREMTHTMEIRNLQRVAVFDTQQVVKLLEQASIRQYLAEMLASFVRTESITIPIRVRKGVWRKLRFSDLDVDSLSQYAQALDEELRFRPYKRIADVCLFLVGMFPEYVEAQYRYPYTRTLRRGPLGRLPRSLEDYEREGSQFYSLAAEHETARALDLQEVLSILAEKFTLAEKPLAHLSQHYLQLRRHAIFGL